MMPTETVGTMEPPKSGVTVRMYNPGFGDCLLLAFRADNGTARYMLIDCGVYQTYPGCAGRMRSIATDIGKATGNHLHVVAITHEHSDHTYGFKYAQEEFRGIAIDDLWLAWTEDPTNPTANRLRDEKAAKARGLAAAIKALGAESPLAASLQAVMDFDLPEAALGAGAAVRPLAYLRAQSARKLECSRDYRNPGNVVTLPGVKDVKVYVLGPPEDEDLLGIRDSGDERYLRMANLSAENSFAIAALAAAGDRLTKDEKELLERSYPFDESYMTSVHDARKPEHGGAFFRKNYGFSDAHHQAWRHIDNDWLAAAMELVTKDDKVINNTSLVLAVELTETDPHKVLLFVGDAQVGNWLSWERLEWPIEGSDDKKMKAADLLRRTVLYKVGHHGSENATLKAKGLELMESADLAAMIPVDEKWAKTKKHPWRHPAPKLLARLEEKTHGRVMRSDKIPSQGRTLEKPQECGSGEWDAFTDQVQCDSSGENLWIQYTIPG